MIPKRSKVILISHKEDIDGIVSAALLYSDLRKKGYYYDQIDIHQYIVIHIFNWNVPVLKFLMKFKIILIIDSFLI